MSQWGSHKARAVLAALLRIGWGIKRQSGGSHRVLARSGWPDYVFAFRDGDEIGPRMMARIARRTGLRPEDLQSAYHALMLTTSSRGSHVAPMVHSGCLRD